MKDLDVAGEYRPVRPLCKMGCEQFISIPKGEEPLEVNLARGHRTDRRKTKSGCAGRVL
ncbi:MAG: hypothetical protein WDO19_00730 [Bacteroidota bacterium]